MDFDFGVNAGFVEELFLRYQDSPESVGSEWRGYFDELLARTRVPAPAPSAPKAVTKNGHAELVQRLEEAFEQRLSDASGLRPVNGGPSGTAGATAPWYGEATSDILAQAAIKARVYKLVNAYRVRGHLYANINPLHPISPGSVGAELALSEFDLGEDDLERPFPTVDLGGAPEVLSLREIVARLDETYCRSIGVEFTQIEDPEERRWLQERMEASRNRKELSRATQVRILNALSAAEVFEQFIHKSYAAGTKRFSLEGGESLIPMLDLIVERAGAEGVEEVVFGMAHRGRLNVLANILDKSLREIFADFEDQEADRTGSGDVKYHMGYSADRTTADGQRVHLTMTFNPSHLEFVNPVVEGRVRAKQDRLGRHEGVRSRVMPLVIHGDAAIIGQGIVPETLNLAHLPGHCTGGTLHIVVNNQIGFTTNPEESRSTRYATDITRMLKVPVFHVNGEDPEAVAHVAQLCVDWRQRFGRDVVIDMHCYRRYGHNEGDEPRYTQPLMYATIDKKPTIRQMYMSHLLELGSVTQAEADTIVVSKRSALSEALEDVKKNGFKPMAHWMSGRWKGYQGGPDRDASEVSTTMDAARLIDIAERVASLPEDFHCHPKILPILKARAQRLRDGLAFDWGTGENLAYASLLAEGNSIRLVGQDVQRGTFSHRHCVVVDTTTGRRYTPFSRVAANGAAFEAYNSALSEAGVLGFEFGYSLDTPDALVIWEAQFGDFLNGAQVIVDQFITSSEDKWHRLSGLTLFLPHGYEGQGPEHSSARPERFLQAAADDNVQICMPTTPAQLFHLLRRQVLRPWRKPLVVFTPKSMLRAAMTSDSPHRPVSTLSDLTSGGFQRVIGDTSGVQPDDIRRVLLCSGKVYYDLAVERDRLGRKDVAILRLEQLYPLGDALQRELAQFPNGTQVVWVQEEPRNGGSWYWFNANFASLAGRDLPLTCAARDASASPATGYKSQHKKQHERLMAEAFGG